MSGFIAANKTAETGFNNLNYQNFLMSLNPQQLLNNTLNGLQQQQLQASLNALAANVGLSSTTNNNTNNTNNSIYELAQQHQVKRPFFQQRVLQKMKTFGTFKKKLLKKKRLNLEIVKNL